MTRPLLGAVVGALFVLTGAAAHAADERAMAERDLRVLEERIADLQGRLDATREQHRSAANAVRELALALQGQARAVRDIEQQLAVHGAELERLEAVRDDTYRRLRAEGRELAAQVRAAYQVGRDSPLKLLLNQDDPARLSRTLVYYEYLARARQRVMGGLRADLLELDRLQAAVDLAVTQLRRTEAAQRKALAALTARRDQRREAANALAADIGAGESRLAELEQDRRDLAALIERLGDALADIPLDLDGGISISSSRGRLPMPVTGPVRQAFGQSRGGGMTAQGWLIGAPNGTPVRSVARGRVAYADWLRGYGLLLILDHGDGFMSLYGHNESLLADLGEWVGANDVIATVGDAPDGDGGLYFELRRDGRVVDPAAWLQRSRP